MVDISLLLVQIHLALIFAVLRPPEGRGLGFTHFLKTRKNSQFFSAKHKYISEALCFSCCHYNSYIAVCSSFQRFRENRMGLWSNKAIAYNLHCEITATYPRVKFQIKCFLTHLESKLFIQAHFYSVCISVKFTTLT